VCGLTTSVVVIAYWIGLPYWWNKSPWATILLIIIGHWLLVNICFHYYMAANTHPGYPPEVVGYAKTMIPVSIQIPFQFLILHVAFSTDIRPKPDM